MSRTAKVWKGAGASLRVQCRIRPGGSVPAVFNSDDVLAAGLYQSGVETAVFSPSVSWNTVAADGTSQTGYDQGQVLVTITATQAGLLQPSVTYNLEIERYLAGDSARANPESIASVPISVRRRNAQ